MEIFERFVNAVNGLELIPEVVDKSELYELIALADQVVSQTEVYAPDYIQALKNVLATIDRNKIEAMTQAETAQAVAMLKQLLQTPVVSESWGDEADRGISSDAGTVKSFRPVCRSGSGYNSNIA